MKPIDLFKKFHLARDGGEIKNALEEALGAGLVKRRPIGDKLYNRGPIEINSDLKSGIAEKVTNGIDAVIELFIATKRFDGVPKSPGEAVRQIMASEENFVFVITKDQKGTKESPVNLTFVDHGTGIRRERIPSTIMSLTEGNKTDKAYLMGSFGQGGQAMNRWVSACLTTTRHHESPNEVSFTVSEEVYLEDIDEVSYQYIVGQDDLPLSVTMDDIERLGIDIVDAHEATAYKIADRKSTDDAFLLPKEHGTVIRCFDVNYRDKTRGYAAVRENLFGMEMSIRYAHFATEAADTDVYNVRGQRHVFNEPRGPALPVEDRLEPMSVGHGDIKMSWWLSNFKTTGSYAPSHQKDRDAGNKPLQRILIGAHIGWKRSIFITYNGQTHARLSTNDVLVRAGLPFLHGYLTVEVNCDGMNGQRRNKFFNASRDGIVREAEAYVEHALVQQLKGDPSLKAANNRIRDEMLATAHKKDVMTDSKKFASLFGTSIAGGIFNPFGQASKVTDLKRGAGAGGGNGGRGAGGGNGGGGGGGNPNPLVTRDPPETVQIVTKHVRANSTDQYVSIRTDAPPSWADKIDIELANWMNPIGDDLPFKNGNIRFPVMIGNVVVGTMGRITVTIDRSSVNLPPLVASQDIEVLPAPNPANKKNRKEADAPGMPKVDIQWVKPDEPGWNLIEAEGSKDPAVFPFWDSGNDTLIVVINEQFGQYVSYRTNLLKHTKIDESTILKVAENDYANHAMAYCLRRLYRLRTAEKEGSPLPVYDHADGADAMTAALWGSFERLVIAYGGKNSAAISADIDLDLEEAA